MFFLKKVFWGFGALVLISLCGVGTQSSSLFMQGIGFCGLLAGLVIFYVFGRMVWKGLGCLPSFLILSSIAVFMMYTLGFFNNGLGGFGRSLWQFLGYKADSEQSDSQNSGEQSSEDRVSSVRYSENFQDLKRQRTDSEPDEDIEIDSDDEDMTDISADLYLSDKHEPVAPKAQQTRRSSARQKKIAQEQAEYPVVYGQVRVISGDTLEFDDGRKIRLFGIDAPEVSQTCADKQGRAYRCGYEAASWLRSWLIDAELECRIFKQDTKGNLLGVCSYGQYDIGAAIVNAGWAVYYPAHSDVYAPYELQAQINRRGLWQGQFYKPWDWRKLQSRKAKIKVLKPKKRIEGIFG